MMSRYMPAKHPYTLRKVILILKEVEEEVKAVVSLGR